MTVPGFFRNSSFVLHLTAAAAAAPAPAVHFVAFGFSGISSSFRGLGFSGGVVLPIFARGLDPPDGGGDNARLGDRLDAFDAPFSFWAASAFGFGPVEIDVTAEGTTRSEPSPEDIIAFCAAAAASDLMEA